MINFLEWIVLENAKIEFLCKKYPLVKPEIINQLFQIDPAQGKSLEWMVRLVANKNVRMPEDGNRLRNALISFYKIKNKPTLLRQYQASGDLNRYTMQDLESLADKIEGVVERPESLQSSQIPQGASKIYDDGIICIIDPVTPENAVLLSKGTKWCTSDIDTASYYINGSGLAIWYKNGKKVAQSNDSKNQSKPHRLDIFIIAAYLQKIDPDFDNETLSKLLYQEIGDDWSWDDFRGEGDDDDQFMDIQDKPVFDKDLINIRSKVFPETSIDSDAIEAGILNGTIKPDSSDPVALKLYQKYFSP